MFFYQQDCFKFKIELFTIEFAIAKLINMNYQPLILIPVQGMNYMRQINQQINLLELFRNIFQCLGSLNQSKENQDILPQIINLQSRGYLSFKIDKEIQQVQQKIQKNQSDACEKYTLKKPAEFLKHIKAIVQSFEQKLRQLNMNFSSCIIGTKYFRCKSWGTGQKIKFKLLETITIEVFIQNCFETFGPEKTKLKVQGKTQVQYNIIQKEFGQIYEKLQNKERIAIFQQLLSSFNLNVFDKLCEQTAEQFDKNPIIKNPYDCGTYISSNHDYGKIAPLTKNVWCQIQCLQYIEDSQEYDIFLPATQYEWDVRQLGKMKLKKSVANVHFSEYLITQIIKCLMVFQDLCKILLNTDIKGNQINNSLIQREQIISQLVRNSCKYMNFIIKNEIKNQKKSFSNNLSITITVYYYNIYKIFINFNN
ncbi:hypothetical protein pb186bvf_005052 [Paramecium bursaria]